MAMFLRLTLNIPGTQQPSALISARRALLIPARQFPVLFFFLEGSYPYFSKCRQEPAEWSERVTPGQSGWLGAAAVGSIPALALSHSQKVNKELFLLLEYHKT